jgi:hypothetical protein
MKAILYGGSETERCFSFQSHTKEGLRVMLKKLVVLNTLLAIVMILSIGSVLAQRETSTGVAIDRDIALLRRDLRTEKKKIIAMNIPLTETEATKFWVIYDQYTEEMTKTNDEFFGIIKDYAANQKTLNDEQAITMVKRWADAQLKHLQTRARYIPQFEKVISGKKAALFFQIDRRLWALLDIQVASEIPLVLQQ